MEAGAGADVTVPVVSFTGVPPGAATLPPSVQVFSDRTHPDNRFAISEA